MGRDQKTVRCRYMGQVDQGEFGSNCHGLEKDLFQGDEENSEDIGFAHLVFRSVEETPHYRATT